MTNPCIESACADKEHKVIRTNNLSQRGNTKRRRELERDDRDREIEGKTEIER